MLGYTWTRAVDTVVTYNIAHSRYICHEIIAKMYRKDNL